MVCYLKMYDDSIYTVNLPDGTTQITGVIISGDEILVHPFFCDPNGDERTEDYFEGPFCRVLKDGKWVDKEDYELRFIDKEDYEDLHRN